MLRGVQCTTSMPMNFPVSLSASAGSMASPNCLASALIRLAVLYADAALSSRVSRVVM